MVSKATRLDQYLVVISQVADAPGKRENAVLIGSGQYGDVMIPDGLVYRFPRVQAALDAARAWQGSMAIRVGRSMAQERLGP